MNSPAPTRPADADLDDALTLYCRRADLRRPGKLAPAELLGYGVAAGGLAFAGGDALGAIVHFGPANAFSVTATSFEVFSWDVDNAGGSIGFILDTYGSVLASSLGGGDNLVGTGLLGDALALPFGFEIGPTLATGTFDDLHFLMYKGAGAFVGTAEYMGFRFHAPAIGAFRYGWALASVEFDPINTIVSMDIWEWAYEDSGAPIRVGDRGEPVPAPGTPLLTLLGLGAMGLAAYRRRRAHGLQRPEAGHEGS